MTLTCGILESYGKSNTRRFFLCLQRNCYSVALAAGLKNRNLSFRGDRLDPPTVKLPDRKAVGRFNRILIHFICVSNPRLLHCCFMGRTHKVKFNDRTLAVYMGQTHHDGLMMITTRQDLRTDVAIGQRWQSWRAA